MFLEKRVGGSMWGWAAVLVLGTATPAMAQTADVPVQRDPVLEIACGVAAVLEPPAPAVRILGGQERKKTLFATGEAVILSGGAEQGLKVGEEYFVRRAVTDRFATPISGSLQPISIHTAGWIRVVDAQAKSAIATVTHACDGMMEGDYLEPFSMPSVPSGPPSGEPDYGNSGRVILADEQRQMGGVGTLMVIDRGSDHGLTSGQWMTVYRDTHGEGTPILKVGLAQVITPRAATSLIKIHSLNDAVYVGDRIAIHK
jgi:hypothetical protein